VTRVDLGAAPGTSVDVLTGELQNQLKTQPYLLAQTTDLADSLRSEMADFRGALLLVAAVVLFAGAFLIFNTLSMTVAELTREVGLLRAAGTTRRRSWGSFCSRRSSWGLLVPCSAWRRALGLGALALSSVRSTGPVTFAAPTISAASVTLTLVVGIVLTLAAALEPAWRAGRIPPVEALRRGPPGAAAGAARLRWLVVVFAVLAVGRWTFWPGSGRRRQRHPERRRRLGHLGTAGGLRPAAGLRPLVLPRVLGPLVRIGGLPFRVFRNEERLARSSLTRDRSRTALTAGALVVGVAMIVALGTAAQDVRKIGASWLTETIPGSELLTSIRPVPQRTRSGPSWPPWPGVKSVSRRSGSSAWLRD
jgi:putative ABC transport system permease protein